MSFSKEQETIEDMNSIASNAKAWLIKNRKEQQNAKYHAAVNLESMMGEDSPLRNTLLMNKSD